MPEKYTAGIRPAIAARTHAFVSGLRSGQFSLWCQSLAFESLDMRLSADVGPK